MNRLSFASFRVRLLLLVLFALLPALGLIILTGIEHRSLAIVDVQADARRLAQLIASDEQRFVAGARQLLAALAQLPQVRDLDPQACSGLFADLLQRYPIYANFGVIQLDGDLACSGLPFTPPINLADRAYFQRTLQTHDFAIGDYQIGRVTGRPTVNFGYPVLDDAGQMQAVVFAALDLAWLNQVAIEARLPSQSAVTVVDRQGTILARFPDSEGWVGQSLPDAPLVKVILEQRAGTVQVAGLDGMARLYAFTPLDSTLDAFVTVGIPEEIAFAPVTQILVRNLAALAVVAVLTFVTAWVGSDVFILRRVRALIGATQRLAAGDLSARTRDSVPYGQGELSQLSRAFDQMAESISALVAEQQQAQAQLRLQALALEAAANGVLVTDREGTILWANPAFTRMTGYSLDEVVGRNPRLLKSGHHDQAFYQELWDTILSGRVWQGQMVNRHKDGSLFVEEETIAPLQDERGQISHFVSIRQDVTQRARAEAALQESEAQFRILAEQSPSMVFINQGGRVVYANQACETVLGYTREEFYAPDFDFMRLIAPESAALVRDSFRRHQQGQEVPPSEYEYLTRDGRRLTAIRATRLVTYHGQPAVLGVVTDITGQKEAEAALRASEARYRRLFEASPEVIFTATPDGTLTDINPAFEVITGWERAQWLGQRFHGLVHPGDLPGALEFLARLGRGERVAGTDIRVRRRAGGYLTVDFTVVPLRDDGQLLGILGIARDVTERRQRERELEAIVTLGAALRTASTRAEMVPVLLDHTMTLLDAGAAALYLLEVDSDAIVVLSARGAWSPMTGTRLKAGEGLTGHVIASGEIYLSDDVRRDPRLARPHLLAGQHAVLCLPFVAQERTLGVIWVGRTTPFTPADVRVLKAIADIGASALHRAALHERTERHLERLSALRTIDIAISASLDVRLTLNIILEQVITRLRADAADVLLYNPRLQTLDYAAGHGFRSRVVERSAVRLGEGLAGRAALERSSVYVAQLPEPTPAGRRTGALAESEGFVTYRAFPLVAKGELVGLLEIFHRTPFQADVEWLDFAEALAGQAAIAIDNAQLFEDLQRSNADLGLAYDTTLEGWSRALDLRDKETEGHSQRVTEMTLQLARALGMSGGELIHVRRGALLHDIGKMGIPDRILLKPGPLTDEEWEIMRNHPIFAHGLLSPIAYLRPALDIPYCHHEKWDGTGYPRGLAGEQIPLAARVFAVADVWDALRSDRPYRPAWSTEQARAYIQEQAGTHFDPRVVEAFSKLEL